MKCIYFYLGFIIFSCAPKHSIDKPELRLRQYLTSNVDSLYRQTLGLQSAIEEGRTSDVHEHFENSRLYYKRCEALVEYYFPGVAKALNGPALNKIEEEDDKVIAPTGFQVVEELIFDEAFPSNRSELFDECKTLSSAVVRLQALLENNEFSDANVFEALRVQINRIISLGISGFDSPVMGNSMKEVCASLEGIEAILKLYASRLDKRNKIFGTLETEFRDASHYLLSHRDFNNFDRAKFITKYLNPLANDIYEYQKALQISNNKWPSATNMAKKNIFEPGVFDVQYFAPAYNQDSSPEMAELGKLLFFDPILSGNNSRSCASCHKPNHGFADPTPKSDGFAFRGGINRNTPTLINSAYQQNQFWDGRVAYIEDQIFDVISNPSEMHGSISRASSILRLSEDYMKLFREAFPEEGSNSISEMDIQRALAVYLRSLTALNSPFDKYMRGDSMAMSQEQITGLNLFMGKAKCGTCHFIPLFNGSTPPVYKETEAEVIGVPSALVKNNATIDVDAGKFNLFSHSLLRYMFKTPTIRNAAVTAPYMHNGVYNTLDEVVDFYNRGGGVGIGIELDNQTLPPDELGLSAAEQRSIVAFIDALTDTTGLTSIPSRLPVLKDRTLNSRKIGGTY